MSAALVMAVACFAVSSAPVAASAATQATADPGAVQAAPQTPGAAPQATVNGAAPGARSEKRLAPAWPGPMSQLVWLDARTGIEEIQLQTFSADFNSVSAGFLPVNGVGPTARIGAGLRLGFVTLGLRGRVASFEDGATVGAWQIWTLDGELGIRVPLYRWEPHVTFAGGYSSFGGFGAAVRGLQDGLDVHGADMRLGFGVDYWVTHAVSLGLDLDGDAIFIARPGVSVRDLTVAKQVGTLDDAKARVLQASGSSFGTAVSLTLGVGLHF
jgi:hypothetical protein